MDRPAGYCKYLNRDNNACSLENRYKRCIYTRDPLRCEIIKKELIASGNAKDHVSEVMTITGFIKEIPPVSCKKFNIKNGLCKVTNKSCNSKGREKDCDINKQPEVKIKKQTPKPQKYLHIYDKCPSFYKSSGKCKNDNLLYYDACKVKGDIRKCEYAQMWFHDVIIEELKKPACEHFDESKWACSIRDDVCVEHKNPRYCDYAITYKWEMRMKQITYNAYERQNCVYYVSYNECHIKPEGCKCSDGQECPDYYSTYNISEKRTLVDKAISQKNKERKKQEEAANPNKWSETKEKAALQVLVSQLQNIRKQQKKNEAHKRINRKKKYETPPLKCPCYKAMLCKITNTECKLKGDIEHCDVGKPLLDKAKKAKSCSKCGSFSLNTRDGYCWECYKLQKNE